MKVRLDPWRDASELARRLGREDAWLVAVLGAEQWCSRCRELRPVFDELLARSPAHEVWLWLDIEEHAEFIGDYFPENLPVLVVYRAEQLIAHQWIDGGANALTGLIDTARAAPLPDPGPSPGIRERLLVADWAPDGD